MCAGTCLWKRAQFRIFRAFRTLHPPKRDTFFEFLAKKKAFHFSKRAPGAGTARNKRLK